MKVLVERDDILCEQILSFRNHEKGIARTTFKHSESEIERKKHENTSNAWADKFLKAVKYLEMKHLKMPHVQNNLHLVMKLLLQSSTSNLNIIHKYEV